MSCLCHHSPRGTQGPPHQTSTISRPHICFAGPTSNHAMQCFLNCLSLIMTENPALDHDKYPDASQLGSLNKAIPPFSYTFQTSVSGQCGSHSIKKTQVVRHACKLLYKFGKFFTHLHIYFTVLHRICLCTHLTLRATSGFLLQSKAGFSVIIRLTPLRKHCMSCSVAKGFNYS